MLYGKHFYVTKSGTSYCPSQRCNLRTNFLDRTNIEYSCHTFNDDWQVVFTQFGTAEVNVFSCPPNTECVLLLITKTYLWQLLTLKYRSTQQEPHNDIPYVCISLHRTTNCHWIVVACTASHKNTTPKSFEISLPLWCCTYLPSVWVICGNIENALTT